MRSVQLAVPLSRRLHTTKRILQPATSLDTPTTPPIPPTPTHNSLPTFLTYAQRTSLSPKTTTYVGTHYEYLVLHSLFRLGLHLTRTGGAFDKGIDLLGTWRLPSLGARTALKVLVQCKAHSRKVEPKNIRALEGAFGGAPVGWRGGGTGGEVGEGKGEDVDANAYVYGKDGGSGGVMALLVTPKEATKGVRDAMGRSRWPMGFLKVGLDGKIEQLLWNRSAANIGLEGVGVAVRHGPGRVEVEREVVLTWNGVVWEWEEEELRRRQELN